MMLAAHCLARVIDAGLVVANGRARAPASRSWPALDCAVSASLARLWVRDVCESPSDAEGFLRAKTLHSMQARLADAWPCERTIDAVLAAVAML